MGGALYSVLRRRCKKPALARLTSFLVITHSHFSSLAPEAHYQHCHLDTPSQRQSHTYLRSTAAQQHRSSHLSHVAARDTRQRKEALATPNHHQDGGRCKSGQRANAKRHRGGNPTSLSEAFHGPVLRAHRVPCVPCVPCVPVGQIPLNFGSSMPTGDRTVCTVCTALHQNLALPHPCPPPFPPHQKTACACVNVARRAFARLTHSRPVSCFLSNVHLDNPSPLHPHISIFNSGRRATLSTPLFRHRHVLKTPTGDPGPESAQTAQIRRLYRREACCGRRRQRRSHVRPQRGEGHCCGERAPPPTQR